MHTFGKSFQKDSNTYVNLPSNRNFLMRLETARASFTVPIIEHNGYAGLLNTGLSAFVY